jgi:predicted  nucleic acid-binding Zn-ribbon protein
MSIEKDLQSLEEQLERAKQERSECEGELKSVMKRLKTDFGVDTIEAAEKLLQKLQAQLDEETETLDKNVTELTEQVKALEQ